MIALRQFSDRVRKAARNIAHSDAGGSLVEMALSSLILATMFFGIFEVTMGCYTYNAVAEAARESARWGMVRGTKCSTYTPNQTHCAASSDDIQNFAKTSAKIDWSQCTTASPCVTATWLKGTTTSGTTTSTVWATCTGGCSADPGNLLVVSISYPYALTFPMVKTFNIHLASTSEVIVSQ
ncbi:TadE/TadG family type IV pilus assembly protein [Telmatobacter sp. DSM 110680]|uniref:TadE/TadG family type IV pilus assembly protein n=1 Tax=Telmatobacter sp. DSM 110680 TaxID=3036704 RepID=A0AAU7DKF2_9BACT